MPHRTTKEVKRLRTQARKLRDELVLCIQHWQQDLVARLQRDGTSQSIIDDLLSSILRDAYSGLVWKTLSKSERYQTPYHQELLARLRKEHPDLRVVGTLTKFVTWPVFRKEDVDRLMNSASVKALFFSETDSHDTPTSENTESEGPRTTRM